MPSLELDGRASRSTPEREGRRERARSKASWQEVELRCYRATDDDLVYLSTSLFEADQLLSSWKEGRKRARPWERRVPDNFELAVPPFRLLPSPPSSTFIRTSLHQSRSSSSSHSSQATFSPSRQQQLGSTSGSSPFVPQVNSTFTSSSPLSY